MSNKEDTSQEALLRLIDQSYNEDEQSLDLEVVQDKVIERPPLVNHLAAILLAWLVGLIFAVQPLVNPIFKAHELETHPRLKVMGIEMYHEAHRIETYHVITGRYPDFLNESFDEFDISWDTSGNLEYQKLSNGYMITGKLEGVELVYRRGDNPEILLHDPIHFAGVRNE